LNILINLLFKFVSVEQNYILVQADKKESGAAVSSGIHKITRIKSLTESTFVLRLNRGNIQFRAGQHIIAGPEGELDQREYSIYSGEKDDYLEILVRVVPDGNVSLKLKQCQPGQLLQVNGPFGSFVLEPFDMFSRKLVFIATGTGISPFHSFVRSYPGIDYTLIHGVRYSYEAYERSEYDPGRYILCTSKEYNGGRKGRITRFLPGLSVNRDMLFYLCGNNSMIYEASHILKDKGIPDEIIFTEVYF
jgi:ferredoxin--NADP+ reductase/benzoate/toluate 1,2-dioxygenase reductase subunit